MQRFLLTASRSIKGAIARLRPLFPLSSTQLLWALGAVTLLLPATAYAWWLHNPVASSVTVNEQDSNTSPLKLHQTAPADIKTQTHIDSDSSNATSADSSQQATPDVHNDTRAQLHVNGHAVPLPSHGSVHKVVNNGNGKTTVDISVNSKSTGDSQSNTSMNIDLNSTTESVSESGD